MEPTQAVEHIEPVEQPEPVPVVDNDTLEQRVHALEYSVLEQSEKITHLESILADVIARNCLLMKPLSTPTVEAGESHSAGDKA